MDIYKKQDINFYTDFLKPRTKWFWTSMGSSEILKYFKL